MASSFTVPIAGLDSELMEQCGLAEAVYVHLNIQEDVSEHFEDIDIDDLETTKQNNPEDNSEVNMTMDRSLVTIWLPASKTDPEVLSVTRTWGCVCPEGEGRDAHSCPFHAALEQKTVLQQTFGERVNEDGFPFMPKKNGKTCTKAQVVAGVRRAAKKAGRRTTNEYGEELLGGHFARLAGARHQRRRGVGVPAIMAMARWDSMCVLRYLKDTVLHDITEVYKKGSESVAKASGATDKTMAKSTEKYPRKLLSLVDKLTEEGAQREQEIQELAKKLEIIDGKVTPKYIVSAKHQKYHISLSWHDVSPSEWRTKCGWKYGASKFERRGTLPKQLGNKEKCLGRGACFDYDDDEDEEDEMD